MVLHANHQYRIGPQGSAYSTVTSTTAASTLRTASIRQERSCTKLAKPKHKPEPPTAQCHFRYGRAAKQVYEKGCLLYTSPSPRDMRRSRMPSSA